MKKKFVKVMLFGALALATTSTITSCKDYDDDVANLQEQIDKITSTSPVSAEELKAAIGSAKSDLEAQLATLKGNLENKDALISELKQKVAALEEKLKNTADKETVNQLTKDLAAAKSSLEALQNLQAEDVTKLQDQIGKLEEMVNALNGLKDSFATKEELNAYVTKATVDGYISAQLAAALKSDGDITSAINGAIQTQVLAKFGSLEAVAALAGENGTVAKVITDLYDAINADKTGALARIVELEAYQTTLEEKAEAEGLGSMEAVIAEVAKLKNSYSEIYTGEQFEGAVKAVVADLLQDANSELGKLKKELADLGIAINDMIQSVVYVPTTIDRSVDFYTLYAKKTAATTAKYEVAAKSISTQELQFRISPAVTMTADEFNAKYVVSLNAEERNWTRASEEKPFAVKVKDCKAGMLTVELTTTSSKSHAISLNITNKADAEGNKGLTPTDINSDYIAVIQSNYYLKTAFYKVAVEKAGEIQYDAAAPVDFSEVGVLTIKYVTSLTGTSTEKEEAFSNLNVANIFTPKYELDGADKGLFEITQAGSVSLKSENQGLVDLLGKKADVKITATSTYHLESNNSNPIQLGSVEITRKTNQLAHAFAAKELVWTGVGADQTFALNSSEIYRDLAVNIPAADYEVLTKASDFTAPTSGIRIEQGAKNQLTLIVPVGSKVGDHTAKFVLESVSAGYTLTVTIPVTIKPIAIDKLAKVDAMWSEDKTTTGFTPVTDAAEATKMTADFALTTSISNLVAVKTAVEAEGGTFAITTNVADIPGVAYNQDTYTFNFDKDAYTGKMTVNGVQKDAQVQFGIVVKYNGREEEKVAGNVEVNNISGTWVAPANRTFELADKTKVYDQISKGFAWTDLRGKTMWADGVSVTGDYNDEKAFATNVKGLDIYGLTAPKFQWSADSNTNSNGAASTYLTLDVATGKVTFTEEGKTHKFYSAVTYTIEVKAASKWGQIKNYGNNDKITITIPAEK